VRRFRYEVVEVAPGRFARIDVPLGSDPAVPTAPSAPPGDATALLGQWLDGIPAVRLAEAFSRWVNTTPPATAAAKLATDGTKWSTGNVPGPGFDLWGVLYGVGNSIADAATFLALLLVGTPASSIGATGRPATAARTLVAALQANVRKLGYASVKPTGVVDTETDAAVAAAAGTAPGAWTSNTWSSTFLALKKIEATAPAKAANAPSVPKVGGVSKGWVVGALLAGGAVGVGAAGIALRKRRRRAR